MEYRIAIEQPTPHSEPQAESNQSSPAKSIHRNRPFPAYPKLLNGDDKAVFGARHGVVQRVALHRNAPSLGNQAAKFLARHALRRGGAGVVINLLLDDRAVQIVGAKAKRYLRNLRA